MNLKFSPWWLWPFFFCALMLLGGLASPVHAKEIYVVTSDSTIATQKITADIQKRIPSAQLIAHDSVNTRSKNAIYIAIGPSALRTMLSQTQLNGMVISAFTSSQIYQSVLETISATHKKMVTAIYADPSPVNQFRLIKLLYKKPTQVAVMLSTKTDYLEKKMLGAAHQTHTNLTVEKLADEEKLNQVLNNIAAIPVILAVPDNTIFSQDNIRNILLTSYRRNQSVIGFSPSLVKAGALATTYSDIEDINAQLEELITSLIATDKLPEPQFPSYFKTIVNKNVAHSLNVIVEEDVLLFSHQPKRPSK